jgi:pimeloyl-ACP methyl ester carboxylesterase
MPRVEHVESADGTRIAYRVSGSGEPMLFVHGAGTSGADWLFVGHLLRDRFTIVAMDRRGRGGSGDAAEHSIAREAEDVLAVREAVGAELLVGHSYGAMCSIRAAEQTDALRRLVLYEPPIGARADRHARLRELVDAGEHSRALAGFLRAVGAPPDQLDAIRSSPGWEVLLEAVPALPRELDECAAWRHPQRRLEVPTLFLLGGETDDPVYLDGVDDLLAAFRDVRRETLPGQHHIGHVFAAERFAELVADFCAESRAL